MSKQVVVSTCNLLFGFSACMSCLFVFYTISIHFGWKFHNLCTEAALNAGGRAKQSVSCISFRKFLYACYIHKESSFRMQGKELKPKKEGEFNFHQIVHWASTWS